MQQFRKAQEARVPSWGGRSGLVVEPSQKDAFICKAGLHCPSLPTLVSGQVSQEPVGIKWKARKVRGGEKLPGHMVKRHTFKGGRNLWAFFCNLL